MARALFLQAPRKLHSMAPADELFRLLPPRPSKSLGVSQVWRRSGGCRRGVGDRLLSTVGAPQKEDLAQGPRAAALFMEGAVKISVFAGCIHSHCAALQILWLDGRRSMLSSGQ
jgi:hypothetical protein